MPETPPPPRSASDYLLLLAYLVDSMKDWEREAGEMPSGARGHYERARLAVEEALADG